MANIESIIALTKKEEGGLSRAKTDTASRNPSPYEHNGFKDWHTNRGVTYEAFKSLSSKLGYTNNKENFIFMPDAIWLKIAKNGYWDTVNLDKMNSQALANLFFSWQWGAGFGWRNRISRYLETKNIEWSINDLKNLPFLINDLVKKEGEKEILDELIEQFKQFYISLNQPANIKGWLNRVERLKNYAYTLLESAKQNSKIVPLLVAGLIITGYFIVKKMQA
jgi:hypothetical protein